MSYYSIHCQDVLFTCSVVEMQLRVFLWSVSLYSQTKNTSLYDVVPAASEMIIITDMVLK